MPADAQGLLRLVARLGPDVKACLEMMSGAVWLRDRLERAGWQVEVADARRSRRSRRWLLRPTGSTPACWPRCLPPRRRRSRARS
jgi:tRNA U34 5-methylaminomethyl-2-thiouridine-forming methyltransferase MnmC